MKLVALVLLALALPRPQAPLRAPDQPRLEELRLLVAMDLDSEAVQRFAPLVRGEGAWAGNGRALALLARALVGTGAEQDALALLRAARPSTEPALVWLEEVRTLLVLDRLDEAHAALTPGLEEGVEAEAWLLFARIQVRRGRSEGVAAACHRFLEREPLHAEGASAWHMLANLALAERDAPEARRCFEEAARLERWNALLRARELQVLRAPDDPLPMLGLGLVWLEAGAFEEAREVLAELVRLHPTFERGWLHLGVAQHGLARSPLAAWGRALALDPDDPETLFRRGSTLIAYTAGECPFEPPFEPDPLQGAADLERLVRSQAAEDPRLREALLLLACSWVVDEARARSHYARYRELGGTQPLER